MAEDLGKTLLGEVEEVGLDEILHTLRVENNTTLPSYFDFEPLDRMLNSINEAKVSHSKISTAAPIVELMSLAPGGGKTHLLYHICALAVLPTNVGGKQAGIVVIDTDGNFSVPRLAEQARLILLRNEKLDESEDSIQRETSNALKHVHIFRPQSMASVIATLDCLLSYLFNSGKHHSFDRALAFISLDSASAFYWQDRAETEDSAFLASTSTDKTPAQPSGYVSLARALKAACNSFNCPAIVTTWHLGSTSAQHSAAQQRAFRSSLPAPWLTLPTLRLIVRRVSVRKFPPGIGVEEGLREAADRRKAVDEGRFECFVNEEVMDERTMSKLQRVGSGFAFRIIGEGLVIEEEDER